MNAYRELKIWKSSHQLVLEIYRATRCFPDGEQFGLSRQLRLAGSAIPSSIAEGLERGTDAELVRGLRTAMISVGELEYCLILARIVRILSEDREEMLNRKLNEVRRLLTAYLHKLHCEPTDLKKLAADRKKAAMRSLADEAFVLSHRE